MRAWLDDPSEKTLKKLAAPLSSTMFDKELSGGKPLKQELDSLTLEEFFELLAE